MIQMVWKRYQQDSKRQSLIFVLLEDLIATAGRTCDDRSDQFAAYFRSLAESDRVASDAQDDLIIEEPSSDLEYSEDSFLEEDIEGEARLVHLPRDELVPAHRDLSKSSDSDSSADESSETDEPLTDSEDSESMVIQKRRPEREEPVSSEVTPRKKSKRIKPVHVPSEPICLAPENSLIELLHRYGNAACWAGLLREFARCGRVNHLRYWITGRWISRQIAKKSIFAVLLAEHPQALDQFWQIAPKYDYAILSVILDARDRTMFEHVFQRLSSKQLETKRISNFAATLECIDYWLALDQTNIPHPAHPNLIAECYRHGLLSLSNIADRMASDHAMAKHLLDRLALPEPDADRLVYHLLKDDRLDCAKMVDEYYRIDPDIRLSRAIVASETSTKHVVQIIKHLDPDLLASDGYFYRMMFNYGTAAPRLLVAVKKHTAGTNCRFFHSADSGGDGILLVSSHSVIIPGFFHWQMEGVYFCSPSYELASGALVSRRIPRKKRATSANPEPDGACLIEYGIGYSKQATCAIPKLIQEAIDELQTSGGFTRAKSAMSAK